MLHLLNTQAYIQDVSIGFCSTFAIINLRKVIAQFVLHHSTLLSMFAGSWGGGGGGGGGNLV